MAGRPQLSVFQRLARDSEKQPNGCIIFTRYADKQGYTRIWVPEKNEKLLAHRVAYELFVGPIPDGYQVDHLCFTRNCVNPAHLEAVTPAENTRRAAARQTHCIRGHAFTPENTRVDPRRGGRICRACDAVRAQEYRGKSSDYLERNRAYYEAHREEINARRRARYARRAA